MSGNGPISPKQCYYEMDYSFYPFYWLNSLEIRLDHNSTYYRSLSKNSDVKPHISHCDSQNLQYKTHPEFWPSHRRIFKTSLYYKTRLILETRRYSSKGLWSIFVASPSWWCLHGTVETLYSMIYYSKYFIELNIDKSTQYVALWTHKRHSIPRPFGRAMECLLWVLQQKLIVL